MPNQLFTNAVGRIPQKTPPIWFMRQAGRYHSHYQALKKRHSFEELCKTPKLAAETALGPINEFDFDVAILFSDILFPLEALGMKLEFNPGPIFKNLLKFDNYHELTSPKEAIRHMEFQGEAIQQTRDLLDNEKSLIGFVGGPWTVLSYAVGINKGEFYEEGFHNEFLNKALYEKIFPLIKKNISLQLNSGAEIIMIFDTSAGSICEKEAYEIYSRDIYKHLIEPHDGKVGYFSKHPFESEFFMQEMNNSETKLAGIGVDQNKTLSYWLNNTNTGFIQGNFNPETLSKPLDDFKRDFDEYIRQVESMSEEERSGWVCGLGHGVLKTTPEENVHFFVRKIREIFR